MIHTEDLELAENKITELVVCLFWRQQMETRVLCRNNFPPQQTIRASETGRSESGTFRMDCRKKEEGRKEFIV